MHVQYLCMYNDLFNQPHFPFQVDNNSRKRLKYKDTIPLLYINVSMGPTSPFFSSVQHQDLAMHSEKEFSEGGFTGHHLLQLSLVASYNLCQNTSLVFSYHTTQGRLVFFILYFCSEIFFLRAECLSRCKVFSVHTYPGFWV